MIRSRRTAQRGFTLLELMIVVAIIGVLAAIAVPAYQDQIRSSRRATAQACLTEQAQFMERFYARELSYLDDDDNPPDLPETGCVVELRGFYTFASNVPNRTSFSLSATPVDDSPQEDDECGVLTMTSTGQKGSDGSDRCWR